MQLLPLIIVFAIVYIGQDMKGFIKGFWKNFGVFSIVMVATYLLSVFSPLVALLFIIFAAFYFPSKSNTI